MVTTKKLYSSATRQALQETKAVPHKSVFKVELAFAAHTGWHPKKKERKGQNKGQKTVAAFNLGNNDSFFSEGSS